MQLYQALITLDGWTFLAQICNLMIQLVIFKKLLLNPVKKVIAERKAKADSQIADAEKLRDDFFDRVQQQLFEDHELDHQVADLSQKRPAIQRDQCLIKLHKRLPFLLKSSSERSAYCR